MAKPTTACQRRAEAGMPIAMAFASCHECGHTMGVHPGVHNKGLDACVICEFVGDPNAARLRHGFPQYDTRRDSDARLDTYAATVRAARDMDRPG